MAITVIHSKRYAFAWHIIGRSWYVPSDPVNDYAIGESKPNYPVPAVLAPCTIDPGMVCIYNVDETVRMAPIVTFYNEDWEFPLPSDHKVIDYSKD